MQRWYPAGNELESPPSTSIVPNSKPHYYGLYVCTFRRGSSKKGHHVVSKEKNKQLLRPRRCPMPVPIICLDEEVRYFAQRFQKLFSKPQYPTNCATRLKNSKERACRAAG